MRLLVGQLLINARDSHPQSVVDGFERDIVLILEARLGDRLGSELGVGTVIGSASVGNAAIGEVMVRPSWCDLVSALL